MRIIVDAGHGGYDPGACYDGFKEKDLTLSTAKYLEELLLENSIECFMCRSKDEYIRLKDRSAHHVPTGTDLFVSLHYNSAHPKSITKPKGLETYYWDYDKSAPRMNKIYADMVANPAYGPGAVRTASRELENNSAKSKEYAQIMQDFIAHDKRLGYTFVDRGIKSANYHVLMINTMFCPSILIELGFMSNADELAKISTYNFQRVLAQSVFGGILKCLSV